MSTNLTEEQNPPQPEEHHSDSESMDSDENERLQYKLIILGDGAVGKTSLTRRFTVDEFGQSYLQTVGVDWFIKTIALPDDIEVTFQIWDIGGQSLESKLLSNYIFGSHCILLTYDITSYSSFKNLQEWYELVCRVYKDTKPLMVLVGNKSDMHHLSSVKKEVHEKFCEDNGFLSFFVSAKTGDGVQAMFYKIAAELAQVHLPKSELEGHSKVLTAQIVNHPLTDAENEVENQKVKSKKSGNKCVVS